MTPGLHKPECQLIVSQYKDSLVKKIKDKMQPLKVSENMELRDAYNSGLKQAIAIIKEDR
jgi:hypothetical protein